MPHPTFHTLEMFLTGVKFYSRECCQFQKMLDEARYGQQIGEVPLNVDPECFVLSYQADRLYRATPKGKG